MRKRYRGTVTGRKVERVCFRQRDWCRAWCLQTQVHVYLCGALRDIAHDLLQVDIKVMHFVFVHVRCRPTIQ